MGITKFYFAYGSNMSTMRMCERIPEAKFIGRAVLDGYVFSCNKKSKDGSSKGNIMLQANAQTWGVIFEIPETAMHILDKTEGGYERIQVTVSCSGKAKVCETYISNKICTDIPFDWYMKYILNGAQEHGLLSEYVIFLTTIPVKPDESKR